MVNHKRKYYRAALEKEVIFSIIPCVKKESNRRALSARRLLLRCGAAIIQSRI